MTEETTMRLPACPTCNAGEGQVCRRPSGHDAWPPHAPRILAAEWELERRGFPEGHYDFVGRTAVTLTEPGRDAVMRARCEL